MGLGRAGAGGFVKHLRPSDVPSEDIHQIPCWTNESLVGDAEDQGHKFIPEIIVGPARMGMTKATETMECPVVRGKEMLTVVWFQSMQRLGWV